MNQHKVSPDHAPDFQRPVHCLLGLPFDAINLAQADHHLRSAAVVGKPCFLSTPNLNFLIAAQQDVEFRNSVIQTELSVADGMPIVWLAKLLGIPIPERVAGSDIFDSLRQVRGRKLTVFFFGGPPGVAQTACEKLNADGGGIQCVGFESPGFGSIEAMSSLQTINKINASKADFVLVALGAKKGQAWIIYNRQSLTAPIISHLGAVVNFVAGTVSRAPVWMQKTGLEWLWRIRQEPGLWQRYARDGLALSKLLLTRVLPLMVCQFLQARNQKPSSVSSVTSSQIDNLTHIRLKGIWVAATLALLREVFTKVAAVEQDVQIDLSETDVVDSAFLGLLLLLYGHQSRIGRRLVVTGVSASVRRIFKYSGVSYLQD